MNLLHVLSELHKSRIDGVDRLFKDLHNMRKSGFKELDRWASKINSRKLREIGYPVNQHLKLRRFYNWYMANNLEIVGLNNVGDPFSDQRGLLNAHEFERQLILKFSSLYGFDEENTWGMLCSSCTDGNNHGIYFGYKFLKNKTGKAPILYVSNEAHYSNARIGDLQNIETRIINTDLTGRMLPDDFERQLDTTRPCLLVYAVGSTFKGAIDDQHAINAILEKHPEVSVYRHLDAALFGGYLPFTKFAGIVNRKTNMFESIAVSGHKFFGMDAPVGLFITTRDIYDSQTQFNVTYLNDDMRMISCSRSTIDVLKFWWLMNNVTFKQWKEQAEKILENSEYLLEKLKEIGYPCWKNQYSNTILIKRPSDEILERFNLANGYDKELGGEISHIVVMQHVTRKRIDQFISKLKESL